LSIKINIYGMSWHKKSEITSKEELWQEIKVVIECLHGIPSMSDKLPNYIYNRIESIVEYVKENGWK
jgi:predicted small metal-binding protein